jgi:hypothetical protein
LRPSLKTIVNAITGRAESYSGLPAMAIFIIGYQQKARDLHLTSAVVLIVEQLVLRESLALDYILDAGLKRLAPELASSVHEIKPLTNDICLRAVWHEDLLGQLHINFFTFINAHAKTTEHDGQKTTLIGGINVRNIKLTFEE